MSRRALGVITAAALVVPVLITLRLSASQPAPVAAAAAGQRSNTAPSTDDARQPAGYRRQVAGRSQPGGPSVQSASTADQRAFLDKHCVTCHNQRTRAAGLTLDQLDLQKVGAQADTWEKVLRKLRAGVMPPTGQPRPPEAAQTAFITSLEAGLDRAAAERPDPGRTETFHRLNRAEYRNAVRDLLALEIDPTELLPADDAAASGFDNTAGLLKLNQTQMERYLSAATQVSRAAVGMQPWTTLSSTYYLPREASQYRRVEALPFGTRGGGAVSFFFPVNGEYEIKIELLCTTEIDLKCDAAGGFADEHVLQVLIDGESVKSFVIEPREANDGYQQEWDEVFKVRLPVKAGQRQVGVTFLAGSSVEYVRAGLRRRFERPFRYKSEPMQIAEPFVDNFRISGPYGTAMPGEMASREAIFSCRPTQAADEARCARSILSRLASRAYRGQMTDADVVELMKYYDEGRRGGTFETGIELALRRLLVSPSFLFRIERDDEKAAPGGNYRVADRDLASRLSFFLWSSIPDAELLSLAAKGRLSEPAVVQQQVKRMLADPRSEALVENFFGQWLKLRHVDKLQPSESLFPDFDTTLKTAIKRETELFLEYVIKSDRSVLELLTADYTFVNERLAVHYGIPNVRGSHFRRVNYPDDHRRGLLGHASLLTYLAHSIRTSPVKRGAWILENLLGTPPVAPPANVPPLPDPDPASKKVLTMREVMAQHRTNPVCSSCHSVIDPAGFALENFDGIGKWRDVDEHFERIDTAGTLPDGTKFGNLAEFRQALIKHQDQFVTMFIQKMFAYALGRGLEAHDMPAVRSLLRDAARENYRFSAIVVGITKSLPFTMRRAAADSMAAAAR